MQAFEMEYAVVQGVGMVICQDQFYTPSVRKKGLKGLLTMSIETFKLRLMYGVPYDQRNCA